MHQHSAMTNTHTAAVDEMDESLEQLLSTYRSEDCVNRCEVESPMFRSPVKFSKKPKTTVTWTPTPTRVSQRPGSKTLHDDFDLLAYQTPAKGSALEESPLVERSNNPVVFTPCPKTPSNKHGFYTPQEPRRMMSPSGRVLWTDKKGETKYVKGFTPQSGKKRKGISSREIVRSAAATSAGAVAGMVALGPVGLAIGSGVVAAGAVGYRRGKRLWKKQRDQKVKCLVGHVPPCQNPPSRSFPQNDQD